MDSESLTIVEFDLTHHSFRTIPLDELMMTEDNNIIYWIHCNFEKSDLLKNKMKIPEEVLRLCHEDDPIAKLIDTDEAVIIQVQSLDVDKIEVQEEIVFNNLTIYLTNKFCLTCSKESLPILSELTDHFKKSIRHAKTPCFILFLLLDFLVNDYAKTLFYFEIKSEEIDLDLKQSNEDIYSKIVNLKHQVMKIKRFATSVREILLRISEKNISVISEECRLSLSNLSNHDHIVVHEADSIREMLNSLLGQIDNNLMQKMNETMRVLTAFAAIFLPLSLITGIYGMNFHWMPELEWKYGYFWALFLIVLCALGLIFLFKKKKWF